MSDVVITRVPYEAPRPSRNLEDRLIARFPKVNLALGRLGQRVLSPRARVRRAGLRRAIISGWSAASRRDWDLVATRYAPDVEIVWDADFGPLGMGSYHGHEGMKEMSDAIGDAWERWEMVPTAVLDMGDRFLALGTLRLPGNASGLEMETELAQLMELRRGLVTREHEFMGWDKGLRAARLDPEEIRQRL